MENGYILTEPSDAKGRTKAMFETAEKVFGFVPNLFKALDDSPVTGNAILALYALIPETAFTPTEQHVVFQTTNVLNECHYCVPAHSTIARSNGVAEDIDEALRNGRSLADPKLEALRQFTALSTENRGQITPEQFNAFIQAGWSRGAALEVTLLVGLKTLTNYTNHLTEVRIDEVFEPLAWTPEAVS